METNSKAGKVTAKVETYREKKEGKGSQKRGSIVEFISFRVC